MRNILSIDHDSRNKAKKKSGELIGFNVLCRELASLGCICREMRWKMQDDKGR